MSEAARKSTGTNVPVEKRLGKDGTLADDDAPPVAARTWPARQCPHGLSLTVSCRQCEAAYRATVFVRAHEYRNSKLGIKPVGYIGVHKTA
jgi:hypothetical protein